MTDIRADLDKKHNTESYDDDMDESAYKTQRKSIFVPLARPRPAKAVRLPRGFLEKDKSEDKS